MGQVEDPVEMARREMEIAARQVSMAIRLLLELDRRLKEWEKKEKMALHRDEPNAAKIISPEEFEQLSPDEQGSVLAQFSFLAKDDPNYRLVFTKLYETRYGVELPENFDLEEAMGLASDLPSEAEVLARIDLPREARGAFSAAYRKVASQIREKFGLAIDKPADGKKEGLAQNQGELTRGEYMREEIARQMKAGVSYKQAVAATMTSMGITSKAAATSPSSFQAPPALPNTDYFLKLAQNLAR